MSRLLPAGLLRIAFTAFTALLAGGPLAPVHAAAAAASPAADTAATLHPKEWISHRLMVADSLLQAHGGAHAERAQLLLTWDAPYGLKRARAMRTPRCDDARAADTLYLSFIPGRTVDTFSGFTGVLLIHAMPGDTLGAYWQFEKAGANGGGLTAEYDGVADFPGRRPYRAQGMGFVRLQRTPTAATLRLVYAVGQEVLGHVDADSIYALGRVVLRHEKSHDGCERPVCIEWQKATIGYALKDEPEVARGERFVGFGPVGSDPVAPFKTNTAPRAWKPKVAATPTSH